MAVKPSDGTYACDTSGLVKLYIAEANSPAVHASVARAETEAVAAYLRRRVA